ncbi:MAG: cysteine--tRNA ligase [Arcobacter butzleri]|jgi:cysteinyl-tRNA synthetase|nr:cysteine--tRNA ligase [Arcobacteraceae bacterium]NLO17804.1 cysteine--tRNA ligase [Aliarcobacter butzleri]
MKTLYIYDSVQKSKLEFVPMQNKSVKIYICGPTVYDDAHLGHARSAIAFDLLHRVLLINGYSVQIAKNITDIDDKIIKKMADTKKSLEEITKFYTSSYERDMSSLNILPSSITPYATQNLEAMIEMISTLLNKDMAYIIDDGVYFDTSKDPKYCSLSLKCEDESSNISRIEQNTQKRNPRDFALWKFTKEGVKYSSPFGEGRPGWHIECSAMINKHLNTQDLPYHVDIHGGGADLLFPHHENEAAQTRCATNKELAKYWMHNGFVTIDGQKMSKSLGNSFFIKDITPLYHSELVRFYMMSVHYRNDLSFNEIDLLSSKKRLDRLYRVKKRVNIDISQALYQDSSIYNELLVALNDDLNISIALSIIDEYISKLNDILDQKQKPNPKELNATFKLIQDLLGIGGLDPYEYFQFGISKEDKAKIQNLIDLRAEAKKDRDFDKADDIRDELILMGVNIMDTPKGTVWELA